MVRIKRRQTLRDEIEHLKHVHTKDKTKHKHWIIVMFSFFGILLGLLLRNVLYAICFVLIMELMRCILAKARFQKEIKNRKEQKHHELAVRTAAETILLLYFILLAMTIFVYGCICYVLHLSTGTFVFKEWLLYSCLPFLLFEVYILQYYKKE